MKHSGSRDSLIDYCSQGKRSYMIAAEIPADPKAPPAPVLERLSSQFELCIYGLGEVRREFQRCDEHSGPILF